VRIDRLDGIRAVAILLVILFHLGNHVPYGWAGVQLFFVLSGYLITGILRKTKTQSDYWSRFYKRRAARILPPMLLLICLYMVFTKGWKVPTILGYTFFAGNFMDLTRYGKAVLAPLWSLAVEEHFYLLWPLAVLLLSKRRLVTLLAAILIAEPILRALATPYFATFHAIYSLTPFQLDSIAAGSLLALLTEGGVVLPGQRRAGWLVLVLLPGLAFCTVPYRDANSVTFNAFGYSYLALLFVAFVWWVVALESGFFYRLLSSKPDGLRRSHQLWRLPLPHPRGPGDVPRSPWAVYLSARPASHFLRCRVQLPLHRKANHGLCPQASSGHGASYLIVPVGGIG
jgi:peptidoglycan/LPS O-acetylase OafA/YrhL